jgi:aspartate racemase
MPVPLSQTEPVPLDAHLVDQKVRRCVEVSGCDSAYRYSCRQCRERALCYRTTCLEAAAIMGEHNHPEITMNSVPLAEHTRYIRANDWEGLSESLAVSARKVAQAGADFAICPDNTYHQAFKCLIPRSPIRWIHNAGAVAEEAHRLGYMRLEILGTRYLMQGPVYADGLEGFQLERQNT